MLDMVDAVDFSARYDKLFVGVPTEPLFREAESIRNLRGAIDRLRRDARNLQFRIDMGEEPETLLGEITWLEDQADGKQIVLETKCRVLRSLLGEVGFRELQLVHAHTN